MFIRSLTLSNILSFHRPGPLELRLLNILIGANASGKSNLIDCIGLVRSLSSSPGNYINDRGGTGSWFWKGAKHNSVPTAIRAETELEQETLTCELTFAAVESAFALLDSEAPSKPSLFFELGAALGMRKRLIAIVPKDLDPSVLPLDVRLRRYLIRDTPEHTAEELSNTLQAA